MRIRLATPEDLNRDETKAVLDSALEAVTLASVPGIARGSIPTFADVLSRNAVKWRPEPPGDEHFDLPKTVIGRGWGDCDDLAPWHAASLRASGEDPEAIAVVRPSGPNRWHAVVQRHDGSVDDPSRWAGMGSVSGEELYQGPFWPAMFGDRLSLATYPMTRGWAGRVDVPSESVPMALSTLAAQRSPASAIVGAIRGALGMCGGLDARADDILRLSGLHDLLTGVPPRDVRDALEHIAGDEVGFGFASLIPAATSLAAPVLQATGILPKGGGGAPAPAPSAMAANPNAPGAALHCPGGPIIIRF